MTTAEQRAYYRANDTAYLHYRTLESPPISLDPYSAQFHVPQSLHLIGELQKLAIESNQMLKLIYAENPTLGQYLETLHQRFDCLTQLTILNQPAASPQATQEINLSAGGMAFYTELELLVGDYLHLQLTLFPNLTNILAIACVRNKTRTTHANTHTSSYRIGVEFVGIREVDQQLIVKHLMQQQLRERKTRATV